MRKEKEKEKGKKKRKKKKKKKERKEAQIFTQPTPLSPPQVNQPPTASKRGMDFRKEPQWSKRMPTFDCTTRKISTLTAKSVGTDVPPSKGASTCQSVFDKISQARRKKMNQANSSSPSDAMRSRDGDKQGETKPRDRKHAWQETNLSNEPRSTG